MVEWLKTGSMVEDGRVGKKQRGLRGGGARTSLPPRYDPLPQQGAQGAEVDEVAVVQVEALGAGVGWGFEVR